MKSTGRESDIEAVFGQLREISRRSSARSRSIEKTLTFVEDSLLRFIATTDAARATDIAAAFSLNRSTVSRQINTLITLGLVHYQDHNERQELEAKDAVAKGPGAKDASAKDGATKDAAATTESTLEAKPVPSPVTSGRGRVLALTESGEAQLATSTRVHQSVVKDRLAGWSDAEIAAFAAALSRYNDAD